MNDPTLCFEDPIRQLPVIFLWPYSGCDCRCAMCDIWLDRSREMITPGEVEGWMDDWQSLGVESVVLTGGEALLNRGIWQIADVITRGGIEVSLISSGMSLWKHADDVVKYCAGVTFSLDGPAEIHDMIRGVSRASTNLRKSAKAIRERRPSFPIRGRCAVHRRNFRFLPETVAFAHELGLTKLSFIAADVTSSAFNRPDGWDPGRQADVGLQSEDLHILAAELDRLQAECAEDFESGFISKTPAVLRAKLHQQYSANNGLGEYPTFGCNAPWKSAVVEPDGSVRPCFFHESRGNLREGEQLSEIINSKESRRFRRELDMATDPTCRRCVSRYAIEKCSCAGRHHPLGKTRGGAGTWGRSWIGSETTDGDRP